MREYKEWLLEKTISNQRLFKHNELFQFIMYELELIGEVHFTCDNMTMLSRINLGEMFSRFSMRTVSRQQGDLIINVITKGENLFMITGYAMGEPTREPLYNFPVDEPEPVQMTVDRPGSTVKIWTPDTGVISMRTSDVLIKGKEWSEELHAISSTKISTDEVLDYLMDFLGLSIDQETYTLVKYDITTEINNGKPLFISVSDKRKIIAKINSMNGSKDIKSIAKQMVLVTDPTNTTVSTVYNISGKTDIINKLNYIGIAVYTDEEDGYDIFRCAMGTPGKPDSHHCYYINNNDGFDGFDIQDRFLNIEMEYTSGYEIDSILKKGGFDK